MSSTKVRRIGDDLWLLTNPVSFVSTMPERRAQMPDNDAEESAVVEKQDDFASMPDDYAPMKTGDADTVLEGTINYLDRTMMAHPPRCIPIVKRCLRALRDRR